MVPRPSFPLRLIPALGIALMASIATGESLVGLTIENGLVLIEIAPSLGATVIPITGLAAGDTIVSIDTRPATGGLYGLGVNGPVAHLYKINPFLAVAQMIGGDIALPQSGGATVSTYYAIDFNPVVDSLRVVSDTRDNFRLNPNTGAVVAADVALTSLDEVVAVAYSNNDAGAAQTTLFGYDYLHDNLVIIGGPNGVPSPNGGVVTAIGPSGVVTRSHALGLEIGPHGTAYAAFYVGTFDSRLYTIDLGTGSATLVGKFPVVIRGIATVSSRGELNGDGVRNVSDVFYLINFLFAGGPPPLP